MLPACRKSDHKKRNKLAVVIKTMKNKEQFERELKRRGWTLDGTNWTRTNTELDPQCVVDVTAQHSDEKTRAAVRESIHLSRGTPIHEQQYDRSKPRTSGVRRKGCRRSIRTSS